MGTKITKASKVEMPWINARYDEVQFVHSNFESEVIAIAAVHEEKVGLGRLVVVDDTSLELGGIYVFNAYRGQGIARMLVDFLLKCAAPGHNIYCIPFAKLTHFYQSFGFMPCDLPSENIPKPIVKKFTWCEQNYDERVELLVLPSCEK